MNIKYEYDMVYSTENVRDAGDSFLLISTLGSLNDICTNKDKI